LKVSGLPSPRRFRRSAAKRPNSISRVFSGCTVPPSGHTAGVYANSDNNFGVFRAPANESIVSALDLETPVTDDEQGPLNEQGINVIRAFKGQGIKIWGARTIAPHDITQWRFVNVRRLLLFIEESIQEGTRFAVFEPNNLTLWQTVKRLVTAFLRDQWEAGALFGETPDKAFRVRVDETLNPPEIRALGQLIIEVTVVPTTPAEFIVFQVIQDPTGATLQEGTK
jgi:Bacteriophage tail sheath protein